MPLAVYVTSLSGAIAYWDTGEAQTVPWMFGIMHPTGFPAYTLLGGVFAHVFAIGAVSWRMAFFSALSTSGAAWLVARTCLELETDPWIAAASAAVFAFGEITWTRGTRAEVHTLALFFAMLAIYAAVRWYVRLEPRALLGGALAWGLAIATHPIAVLLLPAFLLLFIARIRTVRAKHVAFAIALLIGAVGLYAYLPVRSAIVTAQRLDPTRELGLPPGKPFWDTNHPSSWSGLRVEVTGSDFPTGGALLAMFNPQTYLAQGPPFFMSLLQEITPPCVLLALGGLVELARRRTPLGGALFLAFALPAAFGFAFSIEADRDRYYLISFAVSMVLAGCGAGAIARALPPLRRTTQTLVAAMAVVLLVANRNTFLQPQSTGAQADLAAIVEKTPPNAILVAPWLYATPLAYAAYVEHALGNRILDCAWLSDESARIPQWTRTRPVYVIGSAVAPVPGYRAVHVSTAPDIFKLVKR